MDMRLSTLEKLKEKGKKKKRKVLLTQFFISQILPF